MLKRCAKGLPQRGDVTYAGLILNRRGYDRARATERLQEVGMVVPATDTFGSRNQGQTVDESGSGGLRDSARRCPARIPRHGDHRGGVRLSVRRRRRYAPCARHRRCALPMRVRSNSRWPIRSASVCPARCSTCSAPCDQSLGALPLRAHFHNTRNTGIANAFAALQVGVETLDASIGGIGGCPFAPKATGNIGTEDLIYMLDRMKVGTRRRTRFGDRNVALARRCAR